MSQRQVASNVSTTGECQAVRSHSRLALVAQTKGVRHGAENARVRGGYPGRQLPRLPGATHAEEPLPEGELGALAAAEEMLKLQDAYIRIRPISLKTSEG